MLWENKQKGKSIFGEIFFVKGNAKSDNISSSSSSSSSSISSSRRQPQENTLGEGLSINKRKPGKKNKNEFHSLPEKSMNNLKYLN
ncbi:hypothetical protein E2C01_025746 [Portunus trituberculatus]|uniref:Uncharacterized protein n=1 Tax=Portunus trituberculatus TaxID=210409 RepID=A0A5B7EIS6_PORTR|nr:hypothetical protein [Portunus trituberculatus]